MRRGNNFENLEEMIIEIYRQHYWMCIVFSNVNLEYQKVHFLHL